MVRLRDAGGLFLYNRKLLCNLAAKAACVPCGGQERNLPCPIINYSLLSIYFFSGIHMRQASMLPVRAVMSWVTEKVTLAAARTAGRASGLGSLEVMLPPNIGRMIRTIRIPMTAALSTEPAARPMGSFRRKPDLFWKYHTQRARTAFPAMMAGNIRGMAAMIGEPEMKNAVMGATMLMKSPLHKLTASTAIMMVVFTIGPVTYTDRFLKNWLAMQTASNRAV